MPGTSFLGCRPYLVPRCTIFRRESDPSGTLIRDGIPNCALPQRFENPFRLAISVASI